MASGPLSFRTPHIEEIPIANTRQAPGFAWVAVPNQDPAKAQLEIAGKKRARAAGAPNEAQRDIVSARRQREIEKRIRELNNEGTRDVNIPGIKHGGAANVKVGKTPATKKILASGKEFKHYLDDEEAELARTGKIGALEREELPPSRPSKTPLSRRAQQEDVEMTSEPVQPIPFFAQLPNDDDEMETDEFDAIPPFPSSDVVQALLDAPPLTYAAASQTPSYAPSAPARTFCEICGYFGRFRCLKCGGKTCSIACEDIHLKDRCLKFST